MATSNSGLVNGSPEDPRPSDEEAVRGLLLREFDYYADAFWRNEEAGEKRVAVFLSITAALLTIIGFLIGDAQLDDLLALVAVALAIVLLFGRVMFVRLIKRNLDAEGYKEAMAMTRAWFVERYPAVDAYLYHRPLFPRRRRRVSARRLGTGGWLQMVLVANAILAGLLVAFGAWSGLSASPETWAALAGPIAAGLGIAGAVLYAIWQQRDANRRYESEGKKQLRRDYGPLRNLPLYAPDEEG